MPYSLIIIDCFSILGNTKNQTNTFNQSYLKDLTLIAYILSSMKIICYVPIPVFKHMTKSKIAFKYHIKEMFVDKNYIACK